MKYKLYNKGMPIIGRSFKQIDPITLSGIAVGAGSLLSSVFGGLFQDSAASTSYERQRKLMDYAQKLGFRNMEKQQALAHQTYDYQFNKEASLNASLMANSPSIQKAAAVGAGVNPASNFGTFSGNVAQASAPTYTPQGSAPTAPMSRGFDFSGLASSLSDIVRLKQSQELIDSNKQVNASIENKNNQEAEWQRLHNEEFANARTVYSTQSPEISWTDEEGNKHHLQIIGKLGLEAYKDTKKLEYELNKLSYDELNLKFDNMVKDLQIRDNKVVKAIASKPLYERAQILSSIAECASRVALNGQLIKESEGKISLMLTQEDLNRSLTELNDNNNTRKVLGEITGTTDKRVTGLLSLGFQMIPQIIGAAAKFIP